MNLDQLEATIKDAMKEAAASPGRYGGRYVARAYDRQAKVDRYYVCGDDDPDVYCNDDLDILAHVKPTVVHGLGHARYWINADGTIDRAFFDR